MLKVSIITPTFNSEKTLTDTLQSIVSQSYKNIEIIVIDGGSTDKTLDIVDKYKETIACLISEKDRGIYDAMNKGIKKSSGDLIGFLNSDDFFMHNKVIEKIVREYERSSSRGVYSNVLFVKQNNTSSIIRKWKTGKYNSKSFYFGWMMPHETMYLEKSIYDQYGLYADNFSIAGDYEMMIRLGIRHEISLAYLDEYTVVMRAGGKSNESFKGRIRTHKEDYLAWESNHIQPRFYTVFLKPIRKIFDFRLFNIIFGK